jgi:hypothetical protein
MQMQFGVLFIDQCVRWLPERCLDPVRFDLRYIALLVTIILSYDQWYANCTTVAPMSTFVLYRVLSPRTIEQVW